MNETIEKLAHLLQSGVVGQDFLNALRKDFAHAKRDDVFIAISMAMTLAEADLMLFDYERKRDAALAKGSEAASLA